MSLTTHQVDHTILETYPPDSLPPDQIHSLLTQIKDYQSTHGSLLKVIDSEIPHSVHLQPVSVSVFPTVFPRRVFHEAIDELQLAYNELYGKIAEDKEWLYAVTGPLRKTEPLVDALWCVYEEVQRQRRKVQYIEQNVHAGLFRSDYMLHVLSDSDNDDDEDWIQSLCLKQVEFNSYSCAGGCHADKVADMHRFLALRGVYNCPSIDEKQDMRILPSSLPLNNTIHGIASLLVLAHKRYGSTPYNSAASHTAVLMVVQPNNFNIADERPIEYALWNWADDNPIPTYRIEWQDVLHRTQLTETGELLFFPPESGGRTPVEISVIYHRAGYEPQEYSDEIKGKDIRIRLELSRAIKCPSILGHITTIKKVQQALTVPGTLGRWLTSDKADRIRGTFVEIYSLNEFDFSEKIHDEKLTENYILKPASLEGGGHNIYGSDIPSILQTLLENEKSRAYILMQKIRSPQNIYGMLMSSSRGVVVDEVVSELGVFGGCIWEKNESSSGLDMIENRVVGWSFKSKERSLDEMSVVKGFGCFDTPLLVD
ncbi:glutathione synthetase, putative [Talaromyces stipitatus ATCC 10500]|uniref:Glutathione synthetase n=1 Tax=Talaromyces stipitatus (strain ATCC 10500 / CBS 375.48 / QM 6759 / NRRL 1006) TaxID=441959 RepID=B8LYL2_TALSN|nr:glutathione synthetase, putative [Talaromyces stipitatus ATCC 10500]EED23370.1 glutathione synthetase, putative [Talaromyces stipitatus ATCC 10500]